MTESQKESFNNLYDYIKKIFGYDDNQSLPKWVVLRIKGIAAGKYMANNKIKSYANYPYQVILNTFKYCYSDIKYVLSNVRFDNEQHKINYVLKIVENNLNDVYERMRVQDRHDEYLQSDLSQTEYVNNFYNTEIKKCKNRKYDDMW